MTKDDKDIVSAIRAKLADKVGRDRYEVWFGASTRLLVRDGALTVEVPSQFVQDWLRANFRKDIEASCLEALGAPLLLEFRINAACAEQITLAKRTSAGRRSEAERPRPCAPPAPRRQYASLSSFVVGDSNRVAHTSAQMAAANPGSMSPLFVHGPTGDGKTHLLEGVLTAFRQARRQASAIYLSAEQFTSYFLEALHGSGLPSFRRKYRDVELLIVDDVQFFLGKRATLIELLHTMDSLLRNGRQLVLAADRAPAALKALGPEFAARVSGGMVCRVEPPDYQTRLGIVRQLAARLGVEAPPEVHGYIASHFTSQARELAGALKRLQATSMAHERPITFAFAEETLAEMATHSGQVVRLPDIEKAVCEAFGLEPDCLQSDCKGKLVSHPRMLAMWLARKHTRAALSEIGRFFGKRSHSTVIAAHKKIEAWMAQGSSLGAAEGQWKLDEAIRKVEENLRAG